MDTKSQLRSLGRKLRTLAAAGPRRQALVAEAIVAMLVARLAILIRPFNEVSRGFGVFVPPTDPRVTERTAATPEQASVAREIAWAIRAAAPFMPFRSVCLQQAMAAHTMLKRRGVRCAMHFGAGRGIDKPIDAHAWVDAGFVKVTGYPVAGNLRELGCFV